jgi:hypothetical protein
MVQTGMTPSHLTLRLRHSRHVVDSSAAGGGSFLGVAWAEAGFVVFESMSFEIDLIMHLKMSLVGFKRYERELKK